MPVTSEARAAAHARAGKAGAGPLCVRRLVPRPSTNAPPRTRTDVCRDPHASLRLACCGGSTRGKDPAASGCRSLSSSLPKATASEGSRTCAGPRHTSRPGRSRPAGCDAISSFNTLPCLGPASPRREHILSRRRRKASYPRTGLLGRDVPTTAARRHKRRRTETLREETRNRWTSSRTDGARTTRRENGNAARP